MAFESQVMIAVFSRGGPSAKEQMRRGGSRVQRVCRETEENR